jgi:SHS2 domain-containing protein
MNQPDEQPGRRDCGHRSVPHTADLRIEAWGPTREDCIAEAVRGLVESFADISGTTYQHAAEHHLGVGSDADLLAAAVEEVIYHLDTDGTIPASVEVSQAADGGIDLTLRVVDAAAAEIIGAAPKAASLSGLTCALDASGRWLCAVTIDV